MPSINITLAVAAALTALTAAVPHAHHKVHEAMHARHLELAPTIFERGQSSDGSCGGSAGFTCGAGFCCSEWGFCGQGESYCNAGCQSAFGTCNGSTPAKSSSKSVVSAPKTTVTATTSSRITVSVSGAQFTVTSTLYVTAGASTVTALSGVQTKQFSHPGSSSSRSVSIPAPASTSTSSTHSTSSTSVHIAPSSTLPSKATTFSPTTTFSTKITSSSAAAAPTASTTSFTTVPTTHPVAPTSTSSGGSGLGDSYKMYLGDGTTGQGWPSQSSWTNFESMWTNNLALISISCTEFGEANNSDDENDDVKSAIQSVASDSGVDERFILAIVMQESKGCVRAPTTNYGVTNPGLMQSHDGAGSCNNGGVQNPCPQSEVAQMIKDGTEGTAAGDGLKQCMAESKATDVSEYYKAARIYNSGSIAASGNLQDGIATHCYASDIANRLTGWVNAATKCTLD